MGIMETLLQFTTLATLVVSIHLGTVGMTLATEKAGSHTDSLWKTTSDQVLPLPDCSQYEPPPNGNPQTDGTGTR